MGCEKIAFAEIFSLENVEKALQRREALKIRITDSVGQSPTNQDFDVNVMEWLSIERVRIEGWCDVVFGQKECYSHYSMEIYLGQKSGNKTIFAA